MNPEHLLDKGKAALGGLSTPQLATLAATFVLVVSLVIGGAYYMGAPAWALLFSDMEPDAAAHVVEQLKAQKVEYRIDGGGRSIRVPADRVDELRLQFASTGLPSSGRIGFEIFDRTQFGATEFLEQVNYRRALEGEIARTITSIQEVENARVHIAMAKDSLFTEREQPAKASVILKLRSNRPLASLTVTGITNLVAAAVEGLRPDAVVVLDTEGRPLARPTEDGDEPLGSAQNERQQKLEKELSTRVVALLEPVVGFERVKVNVALRLRSESEEATEERWDPENPVVRSRQITSDLGPGLAAGGVAGARGNLPPPAAQPGDDPPPPPPAALAATAQASRSAETVNYEISKVVRHTLRPRGDVARMTVAVMLDHQSVRETAEDGTVTTVARPRPAQELRKIEGLVAAAVGLDTTRGDLLTVETIPFSSPFDEEMAPPTVLERVTPHVKDASRILGVLLLALLAVFGVVRPVMRRSLGPASSAPEPVLPTVATLPKTVEQLEGEIEAQLLADAQDAMGDKRRVPVLTKHLSGLTAKDPEGAARLIRTWLAEERK
ncbi:MAG: flagellar basal-body MS-ring/collar protein FliF [Vicinamibacterales bacterium]|nr:flagellar basal-body MS-ring/collar protein FliF [Vicinamibacterales bacterium]